MPYGLPAGDTDSDGDFDSADVAAITGAYDVRKDANLDGSIDVFDVLHAGGAGQPRGPAEPPSWAGKRLSWLGRALSWLGKRSWRQTTRFPVLGERSSWLGGRFSVPGRPLPVAGTRFLGPGEAFSQPGSSFPSKDGAPMTVPRSREYVPRRPGQVLL